MRSSGAGYEGLLREGEIIISAEGTYAILYLEINLVSVILVGIILYKTQGISKMVAQRNFSMAIFAQLAFFISDTVYVMMKCGVLPYRPWLVILMKEIYFMATTLVCFFWFLYFEYIQDSPFVKSRKRILISSTMVWVMALLLLVNLFTGIFFYVDADGVYRRGTAFVMQYIISYSFVLVTCARAIRGLFVRERKIAKKSLVALAVFPLAPAAAGILQFVYPQLPAACATLVIATLIMYLSWLDKMIAIDPLTQLSNRKHLMHVYEQGIQNYEENMELYLLMIDANRFKSINDTYGHIQGDEALMSIAEALRQACKEIRRKASIARYGGDEFVVLVWAEDSGIVERLQSIIAEKLTVINKEKHAPYDLTVSIGVAKSRQDIPLKELIEEADERLYEAKEKYR